MVAPGPAGAPSNAAGRTGAARTPTSSAPRSLPGGGDRARGVRAETKGGGPDPTWFNPATAATRRPGPAARECGRLSPRHRGVLSTLAANTQQLDVCPTQTTGGITH